MSVGRVRHGLVGFLYFFVRLLLAYRTENAERRDEHKAFKRHFQVYHSIGQVLRPLSVYSVEVVAMQAFGCSRSMHHVVEMVSAELAFQSFGIAQIKLHETNALVLEVFF